MQQPRPQRPTTMARASLDAMYFAGRDAAGFDTGVDTPPLQFWEELAAARERVSSCSPDDNTAVLIAVMTQSCSESEDVRRSAPEADRANDAPARSKSRRALR